MPGKKTAFQSRAEIVNEVSKLEKTKDQASVNAYRQAFRRLVEMDMVATISGLRGPLTVLRKESLRKVKKKMGK
jgi:hypothetical protein